MLSNLLSRKKFYLIIFLIYILGHTDTPVSTYSKDPIQKNGPEVYNAERDLKTKAPKRGRPRKIKTPDSRNAANARERRR